MSLSLFAHPLASYCHKALIALYENGTPFEYRLLDKSDPATLAEFERLWPFKKFPLLVHEGRQFAEATIIVEYLDTTFPGSTPLISHDPALALEARFLDRVFDNYVQTPQQKIVVDAMRPEAERDARSVADARAALETAYGWLDGRMAGLEWAVGERFGLADLSAAPALLYADWTHTIGSEFANLRAYRGRLLARPSVARVIDEARPYRHLFPLGAPACD